jgi:hypothetical protein
MERFDQELADAAMIQAGRWLPLECPECGRELDWEAAEDNPLHPAIRELAFCECGAAFAHAVYPDDERVLK